MPRRTAQWPVYTGKSGSAQGGEAGPVARLKIRIAAVITTHGVNRSLRQWIATMASMGLAWAAGIAVAYSWPMVFTVNAMTPMLKMNAAMDWARTTLRMCEPVISTSDVWNVMPKVKLK